MPTINQKTTIFKVLNFSSELMKVRLMKGVELDGWMCVDR